MDCSGSTAWPPDRRRPIRQAGEDVIFIARGPHLQAIREHGLRVDSAQGAFVVPPTSATDDPRQVGGVDVVIVGVKAWQVTEAVQAIQPMIGRDTFVLPLQNGVEAPAQLAAVLGEEHVVGGLCGTVSFVVARARFAVLATYISSSSRVA